ncbi:glycosyltransferase [Bifidobacterium mongoliense]|uniref:Putative glycosyl transferase n=1 Tax=Bifidobacterium mongoliense DSM 21395 TaxID=1437603 RepID=A0A087BZP0_9BIFI|nr:putative glycosyl transferase [Bifidobacterium mongoliense DSM 21395]
MLSLDIILVVYNTFISSTRSIQTLLDESICNKIIICDNSTDMNIKTKNEKFADQNPKIIYCDMRGNQGIPVAYNEAISISHSDLICLLDDDTLLPEHFFSTALNWCQHSEADIFVPLVYSQDGTLISPCYAGRYTFKPFKSVNKISMKFSAINSGMLIRRSIFSGYRYNEQMFLDLVDHKFIRDMKHEGRKIVLMSNLVIQQDFSKISDNKSQSLNRLRIFRHDSKIFYSFSPIAKIFRCLQLAYKFFLYTLR